MYTNHKDVGCMGDFTKEGCTTHHIHCRSKLHDESRLIQRSFDDNKGDDKKLKDQEYFMITKMMISRIKE